MRCGRGFDQAVFVKLFSLVVVTDDDEDEDEGQWNDNPERIDAVNLLPLWDEVTSFHLCLQNWKEGRIGASSNGLYGLVRDMFHFRVRQL